MKDPTGQLRSATRRAKSDVANKLVSMFLHELSRRVSRSWSVRVDGDEYGRLVRQCFDNQCPYCLCNLGENQSVVEHLDGMNRYRAGLHIPGNVLVACKRCNSEKRRDDAAKVLSLADSGWASFLSHDSTGCPPSCRTCQYWKSVWEGESARRTHLRTNLERIRTFRSTFPEFERIVPGLQNTLPTLLAKLYSDCQAFAESEIKSLLDSFEHMSGAS